MMSVPMRLESIRAARNAVNAPIDWPTKHTSVQIQGSEDSQQVVGSSLDAYIPRV